MNIKEKTNIIIQEMMNKHDFDREQIDAIFEKAVSPVKKYVRSIGWYPRVRDTKRTAGKLKVDLKSFFIESNSTLSLSEVYPWAQNLFYNFIHRVAMFKDKSIYTIKGPWQVMDGVNLFYSSPSGLMPYKWNSSIKIVDNSGDNVALISHTKRHLANLIVAAPDIWKLLAFLYINRENIINQDYLKTKSGQEFLDRLESINIFLSQAYSYHFHDVDAEALMVAISDEFLNLFYSKALKSGNIDDFEKFLDGGSERIENMVWSSLRSAFSHALRVHLDGEQLNFNKMYDTSFNFIERVKDFRFDFDRDNLKEAIEEITRNNVYKQFGDGLFEGGSDESNPYYFNLDFLSTPDSLDFIWKKGSNEDIDNSVTQDGFDHEAWSRTSDATTKEQSAFSTRSYGDYKNRMIDGRSSDVEDLLRNTGLSDELIVRVPDPIKRKIMDRILKGNIANESVAQKVLHVFHSMVSKYDFFMNNYNYDVLEAYKQVRDEIDEE